MTVGTGQVQSLASEMAYRDDKLDPMDEPEDSTLAGRKSVTARRLCTPRTPARYAMRLSNIV